MTVGDNECLTNKRMNAQMSKTRLPYHVDKKDSMSERKAHAEQKAKAESEEERRRAAWMQLNTLVESVHRRPSTYTSEQIEAEITAARAEVKESHRARRSHR